MRISGSDAIIVMDNEVWYCIDGLPNRDLEGGTAMLRKLNSFLNIVIGSFIGVFIGFGIYKFWHFKTYPNLYAMQSAPWYTELLLHGALVAVLVVVCIILKLIIWRKLKS